MKEMPYGEHYSTTVIIGGGLWNPSKDMSMGPEKKPLKGAVAKTFPLN